MATMAPTQQFRPARRVLVSILSPLEKPTLQWLAHRMPRWVNSDHLTLLGLFSMLFAGAAYALARWYPLALLWVCVFLAFNWFGDSLDGTLARYRNQQRPRYGFYVDHIVDAFGALFLLGGLALSGYMHPAIAIALLIAYLLLAIESYLATYTIGEFRITQFLLGPTELRVLLAIGNVYLLFKPIVRIFGRELRLFDVGGAIAAGCLFLTFVLSSLRNTQKLYREETRR